MTEMMSLRKRGAHFSLAGRLAGERRKRDELVHDHVSVSLEALEAAAREEERLPTDERPEALVHLRRNDEVHLAELVLKEHEDDAVRRRRALSCDDEAGDRDPAPVLEVVEIGARRYLGGQVRAEEIERVDADRHARRPVVRQHPLPRRLLGKLRYLRGRLERKRQLSIRSVSTSANGPRRQTQTPKKLPPRPAE